MRTSVLAGGVLGLILASSFGTASADHIWPVDSPLIYPGDSSVQHDVSGLLAEYRESGHFHGGVDIAELNFTDIYSVRGDYNYVVSEDFDDRVAIREWYVITGGTWDEWADGQDDEWLNHWYVHIDSRQVYYKDFIVNNLGLVRRTYNYGTGWWEYPRHLYIAKIYHPQFQHLHFEEEWHNGFEDNYPFPGCTIGRYKYNPLYWLSPFADYDDPVIEEALLYVQGESAPISYGSGTFEDPYLVDESTTGLDVRVHAHDVVTYYSSRNVAPWALQYQLFDEYGQELPEYQHVYGFNWLGPVVWPTVPDSLRYASQGLGWVYDTTVSTNSQYYYWVTNNYKYDEGGSDSYLDITLLDSFMKYQVLVAVRDVQENYDVASVWFQKISPAAVPLADEPGEPTMLVAVSPNPAPGATRISCWLQQECVPKIRIYDVSGKIVRKLASSPQMVGSLEVIWDGQNDLGEDLASGIYLCRFEALGSVETQKILLLR